MYLIFQSFITMDCIFCKIFKGEIPNYTVYEDEHVLAFLDIHPTVEGHTVVVPKTHGATILDFSEEVLGQVMKGAQKATERLDEVLHPDGFSIGLNHGEVAKQGVPHLHIHIIPRYQGDGGGSMHSIVRQEHMRSVTDIAKLF